MFSPKVFGWGLTHVVGSSDLSYHRSSREIHCTTFYDFQSGCKQVRSSQRSAKGFADLGRLYCGHENAIEVFDIATPGHGGSERIKTSSTKRDKGGQKGKFSYLNSHLS